MQQEVELIKAMEGKVIETIDLSYDLETELHKLVRLSKRATVFLKVFVFKISSYSSWLKSFCLRLCFFMYKRPFWIQRVEQAWQKRLIVWLSGVRRVGKTTLARMLPDTVYLNCDLPSVCRRLTDPESFYDGLGKGATVVFDEVHRLEDPSRLLKIAADEYPHLKVLATGSSTLGFVTFVN